MFVKARPLSKPRNSKEHLLKSMCRFNLTIKDVCAKLGISEATFIMWMTDDVPEDAPRMLDESTP